MRLVDADALLEYLMINMGWHDEDGIEVDDSDEKRAIFKDLLDGVSTVDAVPVKHGRWIVDTKFGNDVMSGGKMVTCSRCGKGGRFDGGSPYCSNCGAKMDGGKANE